MISCMRSLHGRGLHCVLLSLGNKGLVGSTENEGYQIFPPKVLEAYPVGCGDSLLAGFICHYLGKQPFKDCLLMAACCGTANAVQLIPGKIHQRDIDAIRKRTKIKKLF